MSRVDPLLDGYFSFDTVLYVYVYIRCAPSLANLTRYTVLASFPGLPMFFNVHEKNREGLVDFHDVMDVVCNDAHWYA